MSTTPATDKEKEEDDAAEETGGEETEGDDLLSLYKMPTKSEEEEKAAKKKEKEKEPAINVAMNGLVTPPPEERSKNKPRRKCCGGCCPEKKDPLPSRYRHTYCYRCCCAPCRLCLDKGQITHCQQVYIIILQVVALGLLATTILFASRQWHLPASDPTYLTVDYVLVVQGVNVSVVNDTDRFYVAYITPFAVGVSSSSLDPPCRLAPSGAGIVLRISMNANRTQLFVQTGIAPGVQLSEAPNMYAWVSNATASQSGLMPKGTDITRTLDIDELVRIG